MTMPGPPGTSSSAVCHSTGTPSGSSRCCLRLLQRRADLDQMHDDARRGNPATTLAARSASCIMRAAAGAELDDAHVFRRAHLPPDRRHPQPDHLAEHLADFGRGDEIAAGAERIAGDVIAVLRMRQAQPHIFGDRHRPGDAR